MQETNKVTDKTKQQLMAVISEDLPLEEKALRESYQKKGDAPEEVIVPFLEMEDTSKDAEIEMFMEWFSNQRFPEEN